jgi:hypothetical protein
MSLTHISRMYFGMAIPDGGEVAAQDWQEFETDHIAAYFPDGYTVLHGQGGWRDSVTQRTIHEPTIVVEVAHEGSKENLAALRIVAAIYKALFQQQAVMIQTVKADIGFI